MLNPINTTMIAVALAPISRDLGIGSDQAIWLVSSLYLASAIAQPTMGKLADRFGPKKIFLLGMVVVIVAGILPALVPTFGGALVSRVLIGIGTSSAYPAAMSAIRNQSDRLSIATPPLVLGGLSISSLVSAAAGPPLAGALIGAFSWHAIFLVNVPLAGIGLVLAALWLPSDKIRPIRSAPLPIVQAIDPLGLGLFAVTISSLLVFLLDLGAGLWWLLIVTAAALVALIVWERRAVAPFIDVRILASNGPLTRTYLRLFLVYGIAYTMTYGFSQWVQEVAGISSQTAGLIQLPGAILAGVASFWFARKAGVRLPLIAAALIPLVGGFVVVSLTSGSPVWLFVVATIFFTIPQGLASVSNQAALYRQVDPAGIGAAAGLSRTSIYIGAIASTSLIGVAYGDRPTTGALHELGWVIVGIAVVLSALTIFDRRLKASRPATSKPADDSAATRADTEPISVV
ncbi:MFS transporter [Frondihabitans sp. VKM Ac-2883]|uniref:MFS transporter n=1 Tax=Frondihabitans sp. VKM Ac-2883 TaxID=2783823 RepID=UPI001E5F860A|nr:MFS transporter [Frondihabitans sp. VKM Ac-2883]